MKVKNKGHVVGEVIQLSRANHNEYIEIRYIVNNMELSKKISNNGSLKKGDKVLIIYSKDKPKRTLVSYNYDLTDFRVGDIIDSLFINKAAQYNYWYQ
jgi:hypothetical protein